MVESTVFGIAAFLGIVTVLASAAAFTSPEIVGGSSGQVEASQCLKNNTAGNIDCAIQQATAVSQLVNPSSSIQPLQVALLIPLTTVIGYIVITKIIIPAASAIIPG